MRLNVKRNVESEVEGKRKRKEEGKEEKRKRAFSRSSVSFPEDSGKSTDSFNHGNRISKAESRKNRERQRLIRRGGRRHREDSVREREVGAG